MRQFFFESVQQFSSIIHNRFTISPHVRVILQGTDSTAFCGNKLRYNYRGLVRWMTMTLDYNRPRSKLGLLYKRQHITALTGRPNWKCPRVYYLATTCIHCKSLPLTSTRPEHSRPRPTHNAKTGNKRWPCVHNFIWASDRSKMNFVGLLQASPLKILALTFWPTPNVYGQGQGGTWLDT